MTQVLAGAVGGILALAGAFLVAWMNAKQAEKQRDRQLAAAFMAAADSCYTLAKHIHTRTTVRPTDVGLTQLLELHERANNLGTELSFSCESGLARRIRDVVDITHNIVFEAAVPGQAEEGWNETSQHFANAFVDLEAELHTVFHGN